MKFIKKLFLFIILVVIIIVGIYVYKGYDMYKTAVQKIPVEEKIAMIRANKDFTKINELPQIYIDAVISVEDHRFYEHSGIDIFGIIRAVLNDIKALELKEGGSTITQQLAKNIYFTQSRELTRKIAEIFMAFDIEKTCNKDEIFELYVNTSYFGDGYYSVGEASKGYFKKAPIDMTDFEATMLAGIPNAPSVYAPTKNLDLALQRQKQVINKMIEYNCLTKEEANLILASGTDAFKK